MAALRLPIALAALLAVVGALPRDVDTPTRSPRLGVSRDRFTLNGRPAFLLGVSYFDARHWRESDLDGLARRGYNLIRVWLEWRDLGFFDAEGNLAHRQALLDLVTACGRRGMVVDVTILDTGLELKSPERAVRSVVTALRGQPNVLYDLVNEHDHSGRSFSHEEVKRLAAVARKADAKAILTVSSTGGHIVTDDGRPVVDAVREELLDVGVDVLAPHFPRTRDWFSRTSERTRALKSHLVSLKRVVPVYLQEEARRGHSGLNPTRDEFLQALREARAAGAAAWIFHTDAGFNLKDASFFEGLDDVERATVDALPKALR